MLLECSFLAQILQIIRFTLVDHLVFAIKPHQLYGILQQFLCKVLIA